MNSSNKQLPGYFDGILNSGDPLFMDYYFVRNSQLPFAIVLTYLLLIKFFGPRFMKNRHPLNINILMVIYNLGTVVANAIVAYRILHVFFKYGKETFCKQAETEEDQKLRIEIIQTAYAIYALKFAGMLDTIFFILKKSYSHISNLHVFHHATVPVLVWVALRSQKHVHLILYGGINCIVHIIMYSYYGLTALSPKFDRIRKWRKYITLLQIVQFLVIIPYMTLVLSSDCIFSKLTFYIYIIHSLFLLTLFIHYYLRTYSSKTENPIEYNGYKNIKCQENLKIE